MGQPNVRWNAEFLSEFLVSDQIPCSSAHVVHSTVYCFQGSQSQDWQLWNRKRTRSRFPWFHHKSALQNLWEVSPRLVRKGKKSLFTVSKFLVYFCPLYMCTCKKFGPSFHWVSTLMTSLFQDIANTAETSITAMPGKTRALQKLSILFPIFIHPLRIIHHSQHVSKAIIMDQSGEGKSLWKMICYPTLAPIPLSHPLPLHHNLTSWELHSISTYWPGRRNWPLGYFRRGQPLGDASHLINGSIVKTQNVICRSMWLIFRVYSGSFKVTCDSFWLKHGIWMSSFLSGLTDLCSIFGQMTPKFRQLQWLLNLLS